jgi:hypothetical protein
LELETVKGTPSKRGKHHHTGACMANILPANAVKSRSEGRKSLSAGLPCLNSNNSIEQLPSTAQNSVNPVLSTAHKRSAAALAWNVAHLAKQYSVERLGFLTLTFPDFVTCPKEAQRRFNSLASNVLRDRYLTYIRIFERCKSGRIHYHLLVVLKDDIRTGVDFKALEAGNYRSANAALRAEWAFWRQTAGDFGFGRTELLPVKSCAEAVAAYIGKYIGKSITCRTEQDKGVRLVEYSKDARMASSRFQFVSSGSAQWRRKVALFAQIVAKLHGKPINSLDDLAETLGSRWAYNNRPFISALPDSEEIEIQEEEATTAQKSAEPVAVKQTQVEKICADLRLKPEPKHGKLRDGATAETVAPGLSLNYERRPKRQLSKLPSLAEASAGNGFGRSSRYTSLPGGDLSEIKSAVPGAFHPG